MTGSAGGVGPVAGTELEAQVLAWLACHVLADEVLPKEWLQAGRITAVGGQQTAREVDDIGAEASSGGHVLIQAKRGLGLGREPGSALGKAIRQVVRQYEAGLPGDGADGCRVRALDPSRDRLIVVTGGHVPDNVRIGLVDAVDRLARLPASVSFPEVTDNQLVVQGRDVVLDHVRRELKELRGEPPADGEIRSVLSVLQVRVLLADDDGPDWHRAIGLLEKVLANPGDARKAWSTLVKYFLEVSKRHQWADRERLRGELKHHEFELRLGPEARGMVSPAAAFAKFKDEYLARVRQRYQRVDLEVLTPLSEKDEQLPIVLDEVFVPQSVRLNPPPMEVPRELWRRLLEAGEIRDEEIPEDIGRHLLERARRAHLDSPPRPVLDVIAGHGGERLVFLGDPGAGKSTLGRYLMLSLASAVQPRSLVPLEGYVPLLVELRAYAGRQWGPGTFLDLIDYQYRSENLGFPKQVLEPFLDSGGRALVVFDGLDEIFDPAVREQAARQIEAFASRYPQARVIVTARPTGYQPAKPVLENGGFARYLLLDLDRDQVQAFTNAWYLASMPGRPAEAARLRDRVIGAVNDSPAVAELAGNPMLLTILAIVGRRQELPRERREVYEHAVSVLVEHWDTTGKHLQDNLARGACDLSRDDKLELLEQLARRMQQGDNGLAGNLLARRDLEAEIADYLGERLQLPAERAIPAARAIVRQLHERNYILASYGAGLYGFVHRAFLEYLAARDAKRRFNDREMSEAQLMAVFQDRWQDPAWEEVLVLLAGMLPAKFTAQAIDQLLGADPVWFLRDGIPRHQLLAVRCLGEIRKLGVVREQSLAVARTIVGSLDSHGRCGAVGAALPALARLGPDWAGTALYVAWYHARGTHASRRGFGDSGAEDIYRALSHQTRRHREGGMERVRLQRFVIRTITSRIGPGAGLVRTISQVAADSQGDPGTQAWLLRCVATRDELRRAEALRALADHWGSPEVVQLLRRHAEDDPVPKVRAAAIEALTVVPGGLAGCMAWLRDRAVHDHFEGIREAAVAAVASASTDPDLADWLHERVVADEHGTVRREAVRGLAAHCRPDPRVPSWLRDRAASDPVGYVRANAIEALASIRNGEVPYGWLQDRAVSDPDEYPRRVSIELLAEHWPQAPGMAGWFRERALSEPDFRVRERVVRTLGRKWHDSDTEARLRDRSATDDHERVREAAVQALAEGWWQAPGAAGWFRERATADTSHIVRHEALKVMAACWPGRETEKLLADCAAADSRRGKLQHERNLLTLTWPVEHGKAIPGGHGTPDEDSPAPAGELHLIAAIWHDGADALPWITRQARNSPDTDVRRAALQIIGYLGDPKAVLPELRDLAVHGEDAGARAHALALLAATGNDDDTAEMIRGRAAADPDPYARRRAIGMLASVWPGDPRAVACLQDRVMRDTDSETCLEAIDLLALGWAGDPDVRSWIRDRAHGDRRWRVRAAAVRALCREGDTALALDRATADRHVRVRAEAIHAIGRNTQQEPSTIALLREVAMADLHPRVRGEALEALGPQLGDDVRAFIRQRARNDPDPSVRLRAALAPAVEDHPRYWEDPHDYFLGLGVDDDRLDEEACALLSELAVTDSDKKVRAAALRVLAGKMRHEDRYDRRHRDDIEALLKDRSASDSHPHVRTAAAEALAGDESPSLDYLYADDRVCLAALLCQGACVSSL